MQKAFLHSFLTFVLALHLLHPSLLQSKHEWTFTILALVVLVLAATIELQQALVATWSKLLLSSIQAPSRDCSIDNGHPSDFGWCLCSLALFQVYTGSLWLPARTFLVQSKPCHAYEMLLGISVLSSMPHLRHLSLSCNFWVLGKPWLYCCR